MTTQTARREHVKARRAELLAELTLESMEPASLSRAEGEAWDYLAAFEVPRQGRTYVAFQVKGAEGSAKGLYPLKKTEFERLSRMNFPAVLLVADVKTERLHWALLHSKAAVKGAGDRVMVTLSPVQPGEPALFRKALLAAIAANPGIAG